MRISAGESFWGDGDEIDEGGEEGNSGEGGEELRKGGEGGDSVHVGGPHGLEVFILGHLQRRDGGDQSRLRGNLALLLTGSSKLARSCESQ